MASVSLIVFNGTTVIGVVFFDLVNFDLVFMSDSNNRERSLRLFISSTFTDMNAERDALMNVFPILKEPCAQRGVNFTPIDLRWGITETEAREGLVFESCMREIDNSRPFFIGIVGHRYGWVPTENDFDCSFRPGKTDP